MKVYLSYFRLKFITSLQYRASAISSILTQFFFGLVNILVFIAFFKSGDEGAPITLKQTVTYLWLNQSFFALIYQFYRDEELLDLVRTGNISYELTRPQDLYFMWYFKIFASRLAAVLLRFIPILVVAFLLPSPYKMMLPNSIETFLLFVLTLILGSFLSTALSTLNPVIVLKTLNEKGVSNILTTIGDILSGIAIPIPFLPDVIGNISSLLPFQYVSDLPFRIYIGNITGTEILTGISMQIIWTILIILISHIMLTNSLKRVVAQGG